MTDAATQLEQTNKLLDGGLAQLFQKPVEQHRETTVTVTGVSETKPEKLDVASRQIPESFDGPLSEAEAIYTVRRWTAEDEQLETSERRTVEEMLEELREAAETRGFSFPASRFSEIVSTHAPNAPHRLDKQSDTFIDLVASPKKDVPPYPDELLPLIESGVAFHEDDHWFVKRCKQCGQFKTECCGEIKPESAVWHGEKKLTQAGRQAVRLDPIKPPKSQEQIQKEIAERIQHAPWMGEFRGVDELQGNGSVKMYIEEFLPEGTTLICGLPKEGKSFLALSVAKALTSGRPLFGNPRFTVPEIVPVLYLAAESGDGALKLRCEKFGITKDKTKFIARTLTQGPMFGLDDQNIESVIRTMRPIIVLETLIRFNEGTDEDDATESRKLAQAIFRLIAFGARAVIGIHHSRKDLNKSRPTKESAVRGSGDGLAMVDCVWLVMQDERLFQQGKGPNEVDVVGWGRDFSPRPMRLALTKKAPKGLSPLTITYAPGLVSCVDAGDLEWVDRQRVDARRKDLAETIEQAVATNPSVTIPELMELSGHTEWEVRRSLKRLGYRRPRNGTWGKVADSGTDTETVGRNSVTSE